MRAVMHEQIPGIGNQRTRNESAACDQIDQRETNPYLPKDCEDRVVGIGVMQPKGRGTPDCRSCQRLNDRKDAKKNILQPHRRQCWVIPPKANTAFVAAMEDVLASTCDRAILIVRWCAWTRVQSNCSPRHACRYR